MDAKKKKKGRSDAKLKSMREKYLRKTIYSPLLDDPETIIIYDHGSIEELKAKIMEPGNIEYNEKIIEPGSIEYNKLMRLDIKPDNEKIIEPGSVIPPGTI